MSKPRTASTATELTPHVEPTGSFSLTIRRFDGYEQIVDFCMPGVAVLGLDERPPLGRGWGPSPVQLLSSAIGACLGSALIRCSLDAGLEITELRTRVSANIRTDKSGEAHIASLVVKLLPMMKSADNAAALPPSERVLARSLVADSLRGSIDLCVSIMPQVAPDARTQSDLRLVKSNARRGPPSASPLARVGDTHAGNGGARQVNADRAVTHAG